MKGGAPQKSQTTGPQSPKINHDDLVGTNIFLIFQGGSRQMPARMKSREALRHYEKLVAAAVELCASPGMLFVASCTYSIGRFGVFGVLG